MRVEITLDTRTTLYEAGYMGIICLPCSQHDSSGSGIGRCIHWRFLLIFGQDSGWVRRTGFDVALCGCGFWDVLDAIYIFGARERADVEVYLYTGPYVGLS
jgi:hypothetical protein